jgi:Flp pilus assembly protein TadG
MRRLRSDSGAVAVEFALVLIPLILILTGVIDFGRAYTQQLSLSAAAREGVRVMAVQNDPVAAKAKVREAAPALSPALTDSQIAISGTGCPAGYPVGQTVTVTVTYPLTSITGMFDSLFSGEHLTGKGVMRCGG